MELKSKTLMTPEEYLTQRVDEQFSWYEAKSKSMKQSYYLSKTIVIVSSALIPLLVGLSDSINESLKYIAAVLGAAVAITEGILSLKKYRENWLIYRSTAEALQREKLMLINRIGAYSDGDEKQIFKNFVERAEQIMSSENTAWMSVTSTKTEGSEQ